MVKGNEVNVMHGLNAMQWPTQKRKEKKEQKFGSISKTREITTKVLKGKTNFREQLHTKNMGEDLCFIA